MSAEKRLRLDFDVRRGDSKEMAIDLTEDMEEDATETAVPAVKDTLPLEEESSSSDEFDCEFDTDLVKKCLFDPFELDNDWYRSDCIDGLCRPQPHWYWRTPDGDSDLRLTTSPIPGWYQ